MEAEEQQEAKRAFLRKFGHNYGYPESPKNIDQIRSSEFKRLLEGQTCYLDHAGATLYSDSQMEAILDDLTSNIYTNPHSHTSSSSSSAAAYTITSARLQVLHLCNANPQHYTCVFTSGATAALKLVGEAFPWSTASTFAYTLENHNSVLGIREYALDCGASALPVTIARSDDESISITPSPEFRRTASGPTATSGNYDACCNLFAFPSECNFSGMKYPLELVNLVRGEGLPHKGTNWKVLIDAAKGSATDRLDLTQFPADFAALSFYKIFGYPTGLGALVLRNDAAKLLRKTYFGGGTVSAAIADVDLVKRRESLEQLLEDGTVSFLGIASLRRGFELIDALTMPSICRHTNSLAAYLVDSFSNLRHGNGSPVLEIYGRGLEEAKLSSSNWGPTISFNLRREDGSCVGYREVERLASLQGIKLRTGCFCNPGACAKYLGLSHSQLLSNMEVGHVCWDDRDVIDGKPTGAVRISFGYMSTFEDAERFLSFVRESFVSSGSRGDSIPEREMEHHSPPRLKSITIFPIKSCAGFGVDHWPLCRSGLLYDREWLLKCPSGEVLTQKKVPRMSGVCTSIDLRRHQLSVISPHCRDKLLITLPSDSNDGSSMEEELHLFGQRFEVRVYGDDVNLWFTRAIGRPCMLVRNSGATSRSCEGGNGGEMCRDMKSSRLSFVNEAQLLLISADSVEDLHNRVESRNGQSKSEFQDSLHIGTSRFRPNLVVSGAEPYAEDRWRKLQIGEANFTSLGGCNRCQMINLDPRNGEPQKSREPLATLATFRRVKGKILFGILLRFEEFCEDDHSEESHYPETWIEVGQQVVPYT